MLAGSVTFLPCHPSLNQMHLDLEFHSAPPAGAGSGAEHRRSRRSRSRRGETAGATGGHTRPHWFLANYSKCCIAAAPAADASLHACVAPLETACSLAAAAPDRTIRPTPHQAKLEAEVAQREAADGRAAEAQHAAATAHVRQQPGCWEVGLVIQRSLRGSRGGGIAYCAWQMQRQALPARNSLPTSSNLCTHLSLKHGLFRHSQGKATALQNNMARQARELHVLQVGTCPPCCAKPLALL